MRIEPMTGRDIADVVVLHRRSINWSMTSRLGEEHVRALYGSLLAQPHFFGFVCREQNRLIGFTTATFDYRATRAILGRLYGRHFARILLMALANPLDLINILESRLLIPRLFSKFDTRAEWLSLVADAAEAQLAPAATVALIRQVRAAFRDAGVDCFLGQSYARNKVQLRKLYGLFGGTVVRRLLVNDFYVFRS
jgi:hypothetical protein